MFHNFTPRALASFLFCFFLVHGLNMKHFVDSRRGRDELVGAALMGSRLEGGGLSWDRAARRPAARAPATRFCQSRWARVRRARPPAAIARNWAKWREARGADVSVSHFNNKRERTLLVIKKVTKLFRTFFFFKEEWCNAICLLVFSFLFILFSPL